MFGHNDTRGQRNQNDVGLTSDDNKSAVLVGDMTGQFPPSDLPVPTPSVAPEPPVSAPPVEPTAPSAPSQGGEADAGGFNVTVPVSGDTNPHPDQLLDIKQQALQHLSPLVDHLEQSASDRFRTTMMMIQASDNASLIKTAYEAALQISDDKERAQALLDLINEINYFTQQNKPSEP